MRGLTGPLLMPSILFRMDGLLAGFWRVFPSMGDGGFAAGVQNAVKDLLLAFYDCSASQYSNSQKSGFGVDGRQ